MTVRLQNKMERIWVHGTKRRNKRRMAGSKRVEETEVMYSRFSSCRPFRWVLSPSGRDLRTLACLRITIFSAPELLLFFEFEAAWICFTSVWLPRPPPYPTRFSLRLLPYRTIIEATGGWEVVSVVLYYHYYYYHYYYHHDWHYYYHYYHRWHVKTGRNKSTEN